MVRFNEFKRDILGMTNTMLSNSLHELENDELITRNQYNEMPLSGGMIISSIKE
ncbi:winged helix-turn-helix transcriptional regulator [Propionispira raffinosivorans]|uniref:winged helix-turn-helix transcriptional regulator n=1 Tax=Propionispira raffinosivorans TaxID=86959 RepID=UPI00389920C5